MSKQKDEKPPKGKQEPEEKRERKGTLGSVASLFKGGSSAKSPASSVPSSPLDSRLVKLDAKEKGRERIGSAPQKLNATAIVKPLTPEQEQMRSIAVQTAQQLNSRQVTSTVDVKHVFAIFDNNEEIKNGVMKKYGEMGTEKFKIPAMKALEAEGHPSIQKDLDRLQRIMDESSGNLSSDVSKETARNIEKGIRDLIEKKSEDIKAERVKTFKFSDVVDEAFGAHVASDNSQGIGFARGQAGNNALQEWKKEVSSLNPVIKLANEFVDLYARISQRLSLLEDLNKAVNLLDPNAAQTRSERELTFAQKLERVNGKIESVNNYFTFTQRMIEELHGNLHDSITSLDQERQKLEGKFLQEDSQPDTIKIESEDRKRHSEVKTLLNMSIKLQEALTGISIGKTVDAPHLRSDPNLATRRPVASSTSSASNNPAPSSSPTSASSQQLHSPITLRGQEHMTPRSVTPVSPSSSNTHRPRP